MIDNNSNFTLADRERCPEREPLDRSIVVRIKLITTAVSCYLHSKYIYETKSSVGDK